MSELATIARPYANALYDVSKENSLNFSSPLESLIGIVSNEDFVAYSISKNDKLRNDRRPVSYIDSLFIRVK